MPLFLAIGAEDNFKGLVDLVKMVAYIYDESDPSGVRFNTSDIPEDLKEQANQYRESLIEAISDFDDDIAAKYLEGEELTEDEIKVGIRNATLSLKFVGVIPGSAFKNKGVQRMDPSLNHLPCPWICHR